MRPSTSPAATCRFATSTSASNSVAGTLTMLSNHPSRIAPLTSWFGAPRMSFGFPTPSTSVLLRPLIVRYQLWYMSDFAGSFSASQRSSSSTVAVQPSKSSGVFPVAAIRSITSVAAAVPTQ